MVGILLYEKNRFFRETLAQILQGRFPGAIIKWVVTRKECFVETYDFSPDIFMLGVNLYSGKDLDLLSEIREKYRRASIILLTDYEIDAYRKEAILRGANHIISKELWTGNEILALVGTILTTKHKSSERTLADESIDNIHFFDRPIERRKTGPWGRAIEQEYLISHPDRRGERRTT